MAKKVCKSACKRNRASRRFREAYRKMRLAMLAPNAQGSSDALCEKLRLASPDQWYAVVWVLQEKALTASWTEVEETIVDLFRKADQKFGRGASTKPTKKPEKK